MTYIPISKQALDTMRTGEPDLSWHTLAVNPSVLWRWHNDPEYHALVMTWHLESGISVTDLLEQHSDLLPYVRAGLPEQYRGMRSSKPLSLALADMLIKDTYGPSMLEHLNHHASILAQIYPDGPPKTYRRRRIWHRVRRFVPRVRIERR